MVRSSLSKLVATLATAASLCLPAIADAQVVRNFTSRYTLTDRANFLLIGNTLMTCPDSASACAAARAGTGATLNNQDFPMVPVDVDTTDSATNSSSATLSIPAGSTVRYAGLYWGAISTSAARNVVRLRPPGTTAYSTLTATQLDSSSSYYQGFADVTSIVAAAGSGSYTVADVKLTTGSNMLAGWALVVVYGNPAEPSRNVTLFDGYANASSSTVQVPVSGFFTPPTGTVTTALGVVAYEGDAGNSGDAFRLDTTTLSDAANPSNNFFNSTVSSLGVALTAKTPNYANLLGFDADIVNASNILANGATSATIRLVSGADQYLPGAVVFATSVYSPVIAPNSVKTVTDLNGGYVLPGDVLEYVIPVSNTGDDQANAVVLTDPIPANTTYVPGSLVVTSGANAGAKTDAAGDDQANFDSANNRVVFRLGTGATSSAGGSLAPSAATGIRFRVTVGSGTANGTTVSNTGTISYTTATLGNTETLNTNTASIQLNAPDVAMAKSHSGNFVRGSTGSYQLLVSNVGYSPTAGTVSVSDTLPAGLTPTSVTATGWSCSIASQTVSCSRSDALAISSSYPGIVIQAAVSQSAASSVTNTATVSGGSQVNTANDSSSDPTTIVSSADLAVTKTGPSSVVPGNTITYTVTVTNNGASNAPSTVVSDPTPSGLVFVSNTGSCTTAYPCPLGTMAPGATATITSTYSVPSSYTSPSTIVNTASVSSGATDPVSSNDSASVSTTASPSADLAITKTGPATVAPGNNVTYTITVTNNGVSDAAAVVVSDPTPAGLTFVSNSGSCTTAYPCSLGSIPAGATRTITSTWNVPSSYTAPASIVNTASVSSTTNDPSSSNNSASASTIVLIGADLQVTKSGPASVTPGTNVVYTVTVTNNGSSDASSVVVSDPTPTGLAFVSNTGSCTTAYPCSLGVMVAGSTRTITSTYFVPASYTSPNPIVNTATASSATADPISSNNSGSASSSVTPSADLAISKSGPASATAGANLVYTVTVTNNGSSDAAAVVVADPTPTGLSFVSNTGSCTTAYPCSLGTVPAGATRTITTTYAVPSSYTSPNPIVNTASVSTSTTDPTSSNNSATASTPVVTSADLAIAKTGPASVTAGTSLVYTVTVTNDGSSDAAAVVVADPTPSGLTFVSNSGSCTTAYPCSLGTVPAGATRTITTTFAVPSSYTTPNPIVNTASVSSSTGDPVSSNNSSTTSTAVNVSADLAITKTGPSSVAPGTNLVYTVTVTNNGSSNATSVVVSDATPSGLVFVSNSGSCTTAYPCSLGTVPAGATRTITTTYSVPASYTSPDPIVNTASVASPTSDPEPANDSATASTSVSPSADLAVTKTGPASVIPGNDVTYTVTVTNNGVSNAPSVVVSDPTPAGLVFVSNGGDCSSPWPCAFGTLAPGATRTVTSTFSVPSSYTSPNPVVNTATASSGAADPVPANDSASASTSVTPRADLAVTKDGPSSVVPGTTITYTTVVSNNGASDATSVVVADPTPAGLSFVSNSGDCTTPFPCSLGTMTAGSSRTITSVYSVPASYVAPSPIVNTASVSSATTDPASANDSGSASTAVTPRADLSITKIGPATVTAGNTISYTTVVTNNGESDAAAVVVADPTPAGLVFVSNSGACTTAFPCSLGTVAAGATRTITSTYTVPASYAAPGPIENTATVSSTTTDPDTSNDSATASTTVTTSANLAISKTGPASVQAGTDLVYTVTVTNLGVSDAASVIVSDPTPAGLTFVSNTGDCSSVYPCNLGTLAAGATATITSTWSVPASYTTPNPIVNTASVSSSTTDPVAGNNTDTESTPVVRAADLAITKTGPGGVTAGTNLVYTILVQNNGPADATGVTVTDPTPSGLTFVSNTGDCTTAFPCSLGTVTSGETRTIRTTFAVPSGYTTPNPIVNTASVAATTTDPVSGNNSSTTSTSLTGTVAELAISKSGPATVIPGNTVTYTVQVTNNGPSDASTVTVVDPTPVGLAFVSNSGACTTAYPCTLSNVVSGTTRTITSVYSVPSDYTSPNPIENVATVSSNAADPTSGNDVSSVSTTVTPRADVSISKTGPASIIAGQDLVYTVTVTNSGPSDATAVSVADPTPSGLVFVSNEGDCTSAYPCSLGTVPAGQTRTITTTFRVPSSYTTPTTIGNTATVSTSTTDPVAGNNSSTTTTGVLRRADLAVVKSGPASATPGSNLVYTITVTNGGASDATSVVLADPTPTGLAFVSNSGDCTTAYPCSLGTIAAGDSRTITTTYSVPSSYTSPDPVVNTASVSSAVTDPVAGNNSSSSSTPVSIAADLRLAKTGPASVTPGTNLVYTITLTNDGPSDAAGVSIANPAPAGLAFVSNTGGCTTAFPCGLGTVASGATVTITSTWSVPSSYVVPNPILNTATASSSTSDPDPDDNSATTSTPVDVRADLEVAKSGPASADAGDEIVYTVVVTNNGESDADAVRVTDPTPAGLVFVSNSGFCNGAYPCDLGTLPAGQTRTITSTYRVPGSYGAGTVVNTATVSSASADPDSSNDSSSATTTVVASADLSVQKTGPASVLAGEQLVYTVVVTNLGTSDAFDVVVDDPTPPGLAFVSNGGDCATAYPCALGDLASGETRTITSTYLVPATYTAPDPIENTATVSSPTPDPSSSNDASTATTSVSSSADLSVTKDGPVTTISGKNVSYTIAVTNAGPSSADSVLVADTLDPDTTYVSSSIPCTGGPAGPLSCSIGTLLPGETSAFTVTVFIDGSAGMSGTLAGGPCDGTEDLCNEASVSSATFDPDSSNDTVTEATDIVPDIRLSLAKSDGPDPVATGGTLTYVLTYSNATEQTFTNARLIESYDPRVTFVSATPAPTSGDDVWSLGDLPPGASGEVVVTVAVDAGLADGTVLANDVLLRADNMEDLGEYEETVVSVPASNRASLSMTKTMSPKPFPSGALVTYTITVANTGPATAYSVLVSDSLPAGLTYRNASPSPSSIGGQDLAWNAGNLAAGQTRTFTVFAESSAQLAAGTLLDNVATADGVAGPGTVDSAGLHAEASVAGASTGPGTDCRLVLRKRHVGIPEPGSEIVYRLLWMDPCGDAQGVVVEDPLPAGVEVVSVSANDAYQLSDGVLSFDVGTLQAGRAGLAYITVRLPADAQPGQVVTNSATISDAALRSQTATDEMTVREPSPTVERSFLTVTGPRRVYAGTRVTYMIRHIGFGDGGELRAELNEHILVTSVSPVPTAVAGNTLVWSTPAPSGTIKVRGTAVIPDPNLLGAVGTITVRGDTAGGEMLEDGFDTAIVRKSATTTSSRPVSTFLSGVRFVTPGTQTTLRLRYRALGSQASALLTLPPGLSFLSSVPAPVAVDGNTASYLLPPGSGNVSIYAMVAGDLAPGTHLVSGSILTDDRGSVGSEFQTTVR